MIRKHKIKSLAAAMLITVANAHANISTGSVTSGDLFLSVFDLTQNVGYNLNLGVTLDQFAANPTAVSSWSLGKDFNALASYFTTGDTLYYNIAGVNTYEGIPQGATGSPSNGYGVMISSILNPTTSQMPSSNYSNTQLIQYINKVQGYIGKVNGIIASEANPTGYSDANASTGVTSGAYAGGGNWGKSAAASPFSSNASVGITSANTLANGPLSEKLWYIQYGPDGGTGQGLAATPKAVGILTLHVDTTGQGLSTLTASVVPLPGAAWLFLSAGMGLLGLQKRRQSTPALS